MMSKTLVIEVIEARSLSPSDINGWADPLAVVRVGKKKIGKTSYIPRTLNPQWKERIVKSDVEISDDLIVEICDHDILASDKMGEVAIPLLQFTDGRWTNQWYRLCDEKNHHVPGYVRLKIQLVDDEEKAFQEADHNRKPEEDDEKKRQEEKEAAIQRRRNLMEQHVVMENNQKQRMTPQQSQPTPAPQPKQTPPGMVPPPSPPINISNQPSLI